MEQAAALTMSDKTPAPSRGGTPGPTATKDSTAAAVVAGDANAAASSSSTTSTAETPATTETPSSPTIAQRASQHGLYSGNLEEEVGQVMRGLGSFWGGFKARSASTLSSLKEDLDKTVQQVQSDLKHLQDTKVEVVRKDPETWEKEQAEEKAKATARAEEEKARRADAAAEAASKDKGKGKAREGSGGDEPTSPTDPSGAQAILNRLSSSTTSLQSSLQSTLASTLAAAKANPTLNNPAQLREQLAENLRLSSARENLTLSFHQAEKMAEDYLKKSQGFLKEAERMGGNLVKDAEKWVEENVKVVPPGGGQQFVPSTGWDSGEWYSFSTSSEPTASAKDAGKETSDSRTPRASLSAAVAGSRKEALLRRLREDKDLLMVDPASASETQARRDEFATWVATKFPSAQSAGREAEEGHVGGIRMALVPEHLSDEVFWQRYLFHKDMIEAADAKRKELLAATQDNEDAEEFSWDDDDEDKDKKEGSASASAPTTPAQTGTAASSTPTLTDAPKATKSMDVPATPKASGAGTEAAAKAAAVGGVQSSAATSPRDSEESYDVVSGQVSTAAATEDSDSDWE